MNNRIYKTCAILQAITCVCFCLAAVFGLVTKNSTIYDVLIDAALGVFSGCCSVIWYKQWKKKTPQDKNET